LGKAVDAGERGGSELAGRCMFSPREPHQWMVRAQVLNTCILLGDKRMLVDIWLLYSYTRKQKKL